MKRAALLSTIAITAAIFGETGESGDALAQCVASTDCTSLGYTETSCSNGGLKCPFANYWSCKTDGCGTSYQYTRTGANQIKPASGACGGKYVSCSCASGYEWNNGVCAAALPKCQVGYIYYTDNTCSYNLDSSKTVKGVVVYAKPGGGGYAVSYPAFSSISKNEAEQFFDSLPKLSLSEAKTNFTSSTLLEMIPSGVGQAFQDYTQELSYALMKAGLTTFTEDSWYGAFITSAAIDIQTTGGYKALWGFTFAPDTYGTNGHFNSFKTSGLMMIPLDVIDSPGKIYTWIGFSF